MIEIDGSQGEGGGQIVRSSLTLSAVTGRAFRIKKIRAGRKRSGLLRQHLTAVKAVREVCGGQVEGAELHSPELTFVPGPIQHRGFHFQVGSAGSAILVAQTVLPVLLTANGNSRVVIEGGTHNMAAPPFDFLSECYLPLVSRMGGVFKSRIEQYGFFPAGGGKIQIDIQPPSRWTGLDLPDRGGPVEPSAEALVAKLPASIGEREVRVIQRRSGWEKSRFSVREIKNSRGPGNVVMIRMRFPRLTEIVTAFGRRGVTAEQVAKNAWREAKKYLSGDTPVGEYLADQLLLPMAIAARHGNARRFLTGELSSHCQTHIDIIRRFLDVSIEVNVRSGTHYEVVVGPPNRHRL